MKKILFILLFVSSLLQANTMFLLTKIQKAYIVVDNYSEKLPMSVRDEIYDELKNSAQELEINTDGYSHRTFGVILYDTYITGKMILNIDLVLGEEIKRLDDSQEVYALTYEKRKQLFLDAKDQETINEETIEAIELLLSDFSEQYREDNE